MQQCRLAAFLKGFDSTSGISPSCHFGLAELKIRELPRRRYSEHRQLEGQLLSLGSSLVVMLPANTAEGDPAGIGKNPDSPNTTHVELGQELAAAEATDPAVAAMVEGIPARQRALKSSLKRFLPPTAVAWLRVSAELRRVTNSRYKRLDGVMRASRRAGKAPILPARIESVVFVCHGNIMRSPVSEAMLRQSLEKQGISGVRVSSAGMQAIIGRSADPRSLTVAPEFGVSVAQHRAQPLTEALVNSSDLVVVMDLQNGAEFLLRFPNASEKLFFLRQFSAQRDKRHCDIPDPYPGDEQHMRNCCYVLQECTEKLAAEIASVQVKTSGVSR